MKTAILGVLSAFALTSPATADQPSAGQLVPAHETRVPVASASAIARPVHAVLRYDLSSAGACRTFSEQPPELCVLFALHVIQMSEHPPKTL
jgi:hypothetical protein